MSPGTAIYGCLMAIGLCIGYLFFMHEKFINGSSFSTLLFSIVTGIMSSCIVTIIIECSQNYRNNRIAFYELEDYSFALINFIEKRDAIVHYNEEIEHNDKEDDNRAIDLVNYLWNNISIILPILILSYNNKKDFLTDKEIAILKDIDLDYKEIRNTIIADYRNKYLKYNIEEPDTELLKKSVPKFISNSLDNISFNHLANLYNTYAIENFIDYVLVKTKNFYVLNLNYTITSKVLLDDSKLRSSDQKISLSVLALDDDIVKLGEELKKRPIYGTYLESIK